MGTVRKVAEEILDYMDSTNSTKRFAPHNYKHGNGKIDYRFGQEWNCGNLEGIDDVFYLTTRSYHYPDLVNKFYNKMVKLNPSLKDISAPENIDKLVLLRGVGSGLHLNDVKYFLENVNHDCKNESFVNEVLSSFAYFAYGLRYPENDKSEEKRQNGLGNDVDFALSPKTAKRVIFNNFYRE